jgi:endonuclease YncB( thermonuclease family)
VKFSQTFKHILGARPECLPQLTWTHFRKLMAIKNEDTRVSFMKRAEKSEWTSDELAEKIRLEVREDGFSNGGAPAAAKLLPKRGTLYTYRLTIPESIHRKEDAAPAWLDLGFQIHRRLPQGSGPFNSGAILESVKDAAGEYAAKASPRTEADLFTYKAHIERVVDGDTMIVKIDLGFNLRVREYLRFRGVNAPEMATAAGRKAKEFIQRAFAKTPHVILTSTRTDKYGRYVADIFYGPNDAVYLNQQLLDQKIALPYD